MVTTGHVDGDPDLGWGDPRSDFFAMPAAVTQERIAALLTAFGRVWHYRIYDTVNDPAGLTRSLLDKEGRMIGDRVYPGEAFMRVQTFVSRSGAAWQADAPSYRYAPGVTLQPGMLPSAISAGQTLFGALTWRAEAAPAVFATSLRLIGADGQMWAQPMDERPLGPLLQPNAWQTGTAYRQPIAIPIPEGTPPGRYTVALLVYDPATGMPWPPPQRAQRVAAVHDGLHLGQIEIVPAGQPASHAACAGALRPVGAGRGVLARVDHRAGRGCAGGVALAGGRHAQRTAGDRLAVAGRGRYTDRQSGSSAGRGLPDNGVGAGRVGARPACAGDPGGRCPRNISARRRRVSCRRSGAPRGENLAARQRKLSRRPHRDESGQEYIKYKKGATRMADSYHGKILHVDLSEGRWWAEELGELTYRKYLGGSALSSYFLLRDLKPGIDPLGPDNLLILMTSVINGLPLSGANRFSVAGKSPLTGGFGEAEAGGYWGPELKRSGFDGIIVHGRAAKPVYLFVHDGQCEIRDARRYWGQLAGEVQDGLEAELGDKGISVLQTGVAGENRVRFAAICNQLRHFNGRAGWAR